MKACRTLGKLVVFDNFALEVTRSRNYFFADIVSQCLYSCSGFSWRYFFLVRRHTTVVGSLEKPEEERRVAMQV